MNFNNSNHHSQALCDECFTDTIDEYEGHRCSSCNDDHTGNIYHDHLTNGNICEKCLTMEDLPYILGMTQREFTKYQDKVRKQLPSNSI